MEELQKSLTVSITGATVTKREMLLLSPRGALSPFITSTAVHWRGAAPGHSAYAVHSTRDATRLTGLAPAGDGARPLGPALPRSASVRGAGKGGRGLPASTVPASQPAGAPTARRLVHQCLRVSTRLALRRLAAATARATATATTAV